MHAAYTWLSYLPCRYTPTLSRAVTHVLVDGRAAAPTHKLSEISKDRLAWPQEVLDYEWLAACQQQGRLLLPDQHRVLVGIHSNWGLGHVRPGASLSK